VPEVQEESIIGGCCCVGSGGVHRRRRRCGVGVLRQWNGMRMLSYLISFHPTTLQTVGASEPLLLLDKYWIVRHLRHFMRVCELMNFTLFKFIVRHVIFGKCLNVWDDSIFAPAVCKIFLGTHTPPPLLPHNPQYLPTSFGGFYSVINPS